MEIERKYKVIKEQWLKTDKFDGERIIQGYLTTDADKTIRVRIRGSQGFMTVKGKTMNISREEIEFPVPVDKAKELIEKFADGIIEKTRYTVQYRGKMWEIDEFAGDNEGLLLAEIELINEVEVVELPEWIGKEVSDDSRYYNSNLSIYPYKEWKVD